MQQVVLLIFVLVIAGILNFVEKYKYLIFNIWKIFLFILISYSCLWVIFLIYEHFYYKSKKFLMIKESIKNNTQQCNELNNHIENLKQAYINISTDEYGKAEYSDCSKYNYKRPELKKSISATSYQCSLSVCRNAQIQPFKYLCKYFNIDIEERTLETFESVLNDFSAAEQGKNLLIKERESILKSIQTKIPYFLMKYRKSILVNKLGFEDINFNDYYFPVYSFDYISPGGNSSLSSKIVLDIENLNKFIHFLAEKIKFRKSVLGQRMLMTTQLREKIKKRDAYTCQHCGLSIAEEPNLLLEIDHVIPLSKGGITTESNLQTLCWKCNRKKGNKII